MVLWFGNLRVKIMWNFARLMRRIRMLRSKTKSGQQTECDAAVESCWQDVRFSDVDIYYNYAFDLGHPVNPVDAARQLLRTGFAQAFRNYATGEDEIADRYRRQAVAYKKYLDARHVLMQTDGGLRSYLKLLLIDPVRYGRALFQGFRHILSNDAFGSEPVEPIEEDETQDELTETVGEFVAHLLGLLAIHEDADRQAFHEDYLETPPLVD